MNKKKQKKSVNIIILLRLLIVTALLLNILVFGLFNKLINDYNEESTRLANVERESNLFRREIENHYQDKIVYLSTLLDINILNVAIVEEDYKELAEFPSYKVIIENKRLGSLLKAISDVSRNLHILKEEIIDWRRNYSPLYRDIKENKSLNKVRQKITNLNNLLLSFEGKQKLQEAKQLRRIKNVEDKNQSAELASQYIKDFLGQSQFDINALKYELNDLALFIEKLNSEKNLYDLPDLRDNKIKQSLERLQRTTTRQKKLNLETPLTNESIDDLSKLIFGEDYYLDKEHQTIVIGQGGYFALRQNYLTQIIQRNKLNQILQTKQKKLDQLLHELNESIYVIRKSVINDQKTLFSSIWNKILLLSILFLSIFIGVALYISFLVKRQIEREEKIKNEINSIFEGTGDAMRVIDINFNILRINTKMSSLVGISPEDAVGMKCFNLFPGDNCNSKKCPLKLVLERQQIVQVETIKKDNDGKEIYFDVIAAPLKENGEIISIIESYRDISDYKKLQKSIENNNDKLIKNEKTLNNMLADLQKSHQELKETQQQLIKSEKMASIGQLSAGVAHEINNPTGFVLNNLHVLTDNIETLLETIRKTEELINNRFPRTEENKAFYDDLKDIIDTDEIQFLKEDLPLLIKQSIDGAKRIKNIVSNLKNFAHPGEEGKGPTRVNEEIKKALNLIHNEIKYNCKVEEHFQDVPAINANSQQLEQVFINLIMNASQAIRNNGLIHIKTYADNSSVIIEVSDNGEGISEDEIKNIFNPFFTTKDVGKGTGLGLSIVYGIIEDHGGKIDVKSDPGKGTKFTISLPIAK